MSWADKFEDALEEMVLTGDIYADAKSLSWLLQEQKSSMFARLVNDVLAKEPSLPMTKAEAKAKASEEYNNHLAGAAEAINAELKAKVRYDKACSQFEKLRSLVGLDKKTGGLA